MARKKVGKKARRKAGTKPRRLFWTRWSDERLLELRLCDLGLRVEGTWIAKRVKELYRELASRGIRLRPHIWLTDEWFSPAGIPGIGVPFYLAHPRLMRLERAKMLEVEGGTRADCLRILRHETGHALQHAYRPERRRSWQGLFGLSSTKYPEYYRPNPASKRYVQNLRLWYAQSHPDEDFAETFAVWLKPRSDWRKRYASWPAIKKLEYVDRLMAEIGPTVPPVRTRAQMDPISALRITLGDFYAARRERYRMDIPNTYDRDLLRLFSNDPRHRRHQAASTFLRQHRAEIRARIAKWSGEYQATLDAVLADMIARCRELRLRVVGSERQLVIDFTVMLTVNVMQVLYGRGRRDWIAL